MSGAAARIAALSPAQRAALFRQLRAPGSAAPAAAPGTLRVRVGDGTNLRYRAGSPGNIDSLHAELAERVPPGPGEVEVEIHAASLNFRDLMIALGLYPDMPGSWKVMGTDWSGRVVAVGEGVAHLALGDEVIGLVAADFRPYVTFSARRVVRKPAALSFEAASTIPTVFVTAWYALQRQARLAGGERVLIHSATGGVGQAAMQIARLLGARIFATAGSPEKRDWLHAQGVEHVFDSRSLDWAAGLRAATGGEGVDVVLNSLPGEAIALGVQALRAGGRFIEIGVRDFQTDAALPLRLFGQGVSFIASGVIHFPAEQEATLVREMMAEIVALFEAGRLAPPTSRVFDLPDIAEAFGFMSAGSHMGKITLRMHGQTVTARQAA